MKAYGMRLATTVASIIGEASRKEPNCPLTAIWLYGPIVGLGMGRDIDLILEVDETTYEKYARFCASVLDGVHPFSREMLEDKHSAVYDHLSPKGDRTMAALDAIGINLYKLGLGVLEDSLNVVCLPPGWTSLTGSLYLKADKEPNKGEQLFFLDTIGKSIQVFPQG